jgi:hypothetical protein
MRKKQSITKEEAMILLQSQPLDANLWQLSNPDLKTNAFRFPDPSFVDSFDWPDYMKESKKQKLESGKNEKLYSNQETKPIESNEVKAIEVESKVESSDEIIADQFFREESIENKITATEKDRFEENKETVNLDKLGNLSEKKARGSSTRKSRISNEEIFNNDISPEKLKIEQEYTTTPMDTNSTSMESLNFYEWLEELKVSVPGGSIEEQKSIKPKVGRQKTKISKPAQQTADAKTVAENSLKLGEEIVSETLARLLARQGHKEDAVEMYQKLILKYPEKEATFAAAIQKFKS